jgi:hypothetical protein
VASSWSLEEYPTPEGIKIAALLYPVSDRDIDRKHSLMRYEFLIVCGHVAYCTDSNNDDRLSHVQFATELDLIFAGGLNK